jgi:biopolymer transport protein ExbD
MLKDDRQQHVKHRAGRLAQFVKHQNDRSVLPTANTEKQSTTPETLTLTIQADGRYSLNQQAIKATTVADIQAALQSAQIGPQTVLVIAADQNVRHQSVVTAMEAARRSGLSRVTFAAQSSATANNQAADKRSSAK